MTLLCCFTVESANSRVQSFGLGQESFLGGFVMIVGQKLRSTLLVSVLTIGAIPAHAGIWDDPENLQVLPENISPEELGMTMRGFAQGTGSRCSACHVGKVEADLGTYEFELDDKEKKLKAREMIQLVQSINDQIAAVFPDTSEPLVKVTCATCHRGQAKPVMIEDMLAKTVAEDGVDEAIVEYRQLRQKYYGGYTYDFSERSLMRFAEDLAAQEELLASIRFLDLNIEYYPQSSRSYLQRGEVYAELGEISAARKNFTKALEIEPQSNWIRERLESLDQG